MAVQLPNTPINIQRDEVRTSSGVSCASRGGSDVSLEVGTVLSSAPVAVGIGGVQTGAGAAVYARVVIPLTDVPARLDCNQVLQLEVERLRLELQSLKDEKAFN